MVGEIKSSHIIKVKDGRAYLHSEYQGWSPSGIVYEGVIPLGNDPKYIEKARDHFGVEEKNAK